MYPSSSLVPNDPTMLLTTAGMVQFKPYFEGKERPKFTRIASVQKCARTTDIDRVGRTARHLTFFEMLGNFSLGDYYKKEAIVWAWELVTKHFKIDKDRLWATVYLDDDEAFSIWQNETDINNERIARLGEDNFWSVGDVGPCGPSSEIFYDFGQERACGPDCKIGCDCDRWMEVWNLVFMQFERCADKSLKELPSKNIDTGMGLERIASILQGAPDNFHTDVIKPILDLVSKLVKTNLGESEQSDVSLKIIADHSRAMTFLISDGVIPSNEGRGYVLRRLIRRSIRHGWLLGMEKPFLDKPVNEVIKIMGDHYYELENNKDYILRIIATEEERFGHTLRQGIEIINDQVEELKKTKEKIISGELIFKLHDTYGFPVELTAEIASENALTLDMKKYENLMKDQKKRARAAWKEEEKEYTPVYSHVLDKAGSTEFKGYTDFETNSQIKAIVLDGREVDKIDAGAEGELFLDVSPFYAEKGGQVADTGFIGKPKAQAKVEEAKEGLSGMIIHKVKVHEGSFKVGDSVSTVVDRSHRLAVTRAHTATHILHWALRQLLGTHVKQAGSFVEDDRLRFDFTHFEALTQTQLQEIEGMVNQKILDALPVKAYETTIDYAKETGAIAFFNEKYGDFVRIVEAGDFSKELCGGTHVSNTAFINLFKIKSEASVGANLRRIEAFTGSKILQALNKNEQLIADLSASLKVNPQALTQKTDSLLRENQQLKKDIEKAKKGTAHDELEKIASSAQALNGLKVLTFAIEDADMQTLRDYADNLRKKLGKSAVMLASSKDGKAMVLAAASKEAVDSGFDASAWLKEVLPIVDGSGGGKAQLAQAGGKKPEKISEALEKALDYVKQRA